MTAWTTETTDMERSPLVLKAIRTAEYRYNIPDNPRYRTNPDGATFDRIAHLDGLREPDVTTWVAAHTTDGVHVMACFAVGAGLGQVQPYADNAYMISVSRDDMREVRRIARKELDDAKAAARA